MERQPDVLPDDEDIDLFGDPDGVDVPPAEEQLDERLEEERQPD